MPNKHYIKGYKKEQRIVNNLKKLGFDIAQRTAGSHSPIDIIAVHRKTKKICLIQAKPRGYSDKKIMEDMKWLCDEFQVEFWVE